MPYINGVKYLTIGEAARILGVPRAHVLAAIRDKKLRAKVKFAGEVVEVRPRTHEDGGGSSGCSSTTARTP